MIARSLQLCVAQFASCYPMPSAFWRFQQPERTRLWATITINGITLDPASREQARPVAPMAQLDRTVAITHIFDTTDFD